MRKEDLIALINNKTAKAQQERQLNGSALRIIGIDPDVDRNGVAQQNTTTREIHAGMLTFAELTDRLIAIHSDPAIRDTTRIVVEAGWLNKAHWHLTRHDTPQAAAAKGNATGRNHEVGRKIVELCQHWGIHVEQQHPLLKTWQGHDGKITQREIEYITHQKLGRINQEGRDAALIAWNAANLPIVAPPPERTQKKTAPATARTTHREARFGTPKK